jgi:hypothetical protein
MVHISIYKVRHKVKKPLPVPGSNHLYSVDPYVDHPVSDRKRDQDPKPVVYWIDSVKEPVPGPVAIAEVRASETKVARERDR